MKTKDIIEKGYFPKELPPFFSSKLLAKQMKISEIMNITGEPTSSKTINFSVPKSKSRRRTISLPNPYHQIKLAKNIRDNWKELNKFYSSSQISLTRPVIDINKNRALIPEYPFNEITKQRVIKSTASKYLLKTDISRYYSTIYTHSISWALHGKEHAKRNKNDRKLLGNVLDFYVRNTKEQQTLGIPVGPDTSLVISEILGTKIDNMICDNIASVKGFRYIDDIYLYFKNLGDAEKAKYIINSIFSEFELEMNAEKTEIIKLHNSVEPEWISELRLHSFRSRSEKDIISYFSKMFNYSELYPNEAVIKYGINRIRNTDVSATNWTVFESFLMKAILADGSCIKTVLQIIVKYFCRNYNINFEIIEETLNYIIDYSCNYYNTYEILWALWYLIVFNLTMEYEVQKKIVEYDNPLVALMILYLREEGKIDEKLDLRLWKSYMKSEELYGKNWILAYEAYYRKWLPAKSGKNYIKSRKFFNNIFKKGVSFTLDKDYIDNEYVYDIFEEQDNLELQDIEIEQINDYFE